MTKIRFRLGVRFRSRLKIWYWINGKVRIFFWFWISSYFADFGQVKKLLYMAAFWMAASDLSTKTPLGETGYLSIYFFYLFFFIIFWMPRHPVFSSLACDLWDTMPHQRSLPLLPREAEDLPRGERHFKHVLPLTYLIYLSPKELY